MSTNTERNGTNSGIKMKCAICSLPLEGVMIGCGDGTGSKYAHPECFYRKEGTDKDAEIASLRDEVKEENSQLATVQYEALQRAIQFDKDMAYAQRQIQGLRTRAEQAEVELGGIRGIMATYGRIEDTAENLVRKMCKDFDECLDRLEQAEARVEKVRDLIEESEEVPHLEITSGNVAKMLKEILK